MMKTAVFDFDGTIHNTKKLYGRAFRKAYSMLVSEGYAKERDYTDDEVSVYLGMSAPDMWHSFMPELAKPVMERASMLIGREMTEGVLSGKAVLYSGIAEVLTALRSRGIRLMILSNCRHGYMEAHREALGLDKWFDDYFCGEDYGFIPKDEIFRILMNKYPDSSYIMIGDRASDIDAGIKNGIPAIGCLYGFGSSDELSSATALAYSPQDILSLTEKLFDTNIR